MPERECVNCGGHRPSFTSSAVARILGTPEANVPVASPGMAGEAVAEVPRELAGRHIEHMVTAARDALARGIRILPAVHPIVGIGLKQAARPLRLVAR